MPHEAFVAELRRALPSALHEAEGRYVLRPASQTELAHAMRLAHRLGGALQPPGGERRPGAVEVDLARLDDVLGFDETSRVVHVQAGVLLAELESQLERRGATLGLVGAVPERALGRWLAEGAPGARAHADDPVDQLLAGVDAILPDGRELSIRPAPRRAVGPDWIGALLGARGRLGILTAAHLVTHAAMPTRNVSFRFTAHEDAIAALAWMRGRGVRPFGSAVEPLGGDGGARLTLRLRGPRPRLGTQLDVVRVTATDHGGRETGSPAETLGPEHTGAPPADSLLRALASELDRGGVLGR